MLDFGALPPEVNSDRMNAGPGSGPIVDAARHDRRLPANWTRSLCGDDGTDDGGHRLRVTPQGGG
jgi:PPE family